MKKKPDVPHGASIKGVISNGGIFDFRLEYFASHLLNTSFPAYSIRRYDFYAVIWLRGGSGRFQVDFMTYDFRGEKMIFLSPGQFFNVQFGRFEVIRYSFRREFFCVQENNPEILCNGVLFNHLYAVASIEVSSILREEFEALNKEFLAVEILQKAYAVPILKKLLTIAVAAWRTQSPFHPDMTERETDQLFTLKRAIDLHLNALPTLGTFAIELGESDQYLRQLIRRRLGMTISNLVALRQVLEANRALSFTDKPVKTIANELGFNDPAYFNRFFKKHTGKTPQELRHQYAGEAPDTLLMQLQSLIETHYISERQPAFYARKLFLTTRTLTDILNRKINTTCTRLISQRLLLQAKRELLLSRKTIKTIAFDLHFEEPGHFSRFFKKSTGVSPESFRLGSNEFAENLNTHNWMLRN